jgi:hypothetical protein
LRVDVDEGMGEDLRRKAEGEVGEREDLGERGRRCWARARRRRGRPTKVQEIVETREEKMPATIRSQS